MERIKDIRPRFHKKLYISKSAVEGNGLFAGENIKAGETILSFGGTIALISERKSGKYLQSTFSCITDDIMICEEIESEKDYSDYINHSCVPNIGMSDCLTLVAITDIKQDEELVCDYTFWEADESWELTCKCNCGNSRCRKRITGMDWRNVKPTDTFFQYYAPFIQRRIIRNEKEN